MRALPSPLHLLEFVAGFQHYHFGHFEEPGDSLRAAQDRMSLWGLRHFARGAALVDIGCGLGGASQLLAARGLDVTALDPCPAALAYARTLAAVPEGGPRFVDDELEGFARARAGGFDGALAIEVLQHFPDLAGFLGQCRSLLRPAGVLVLHHVSIDLEIEWERVPFHRRGCVLAVAESAGFQVLEHQDLTRAILPTLPRLMRALEWHRAELHEAFGGRHGRPVEAELSEVLSHMAELQRALEHGPLVYEVTALRRAAAQPQ